MTKCFLIELSGKVAGSLLLIAMLYIHYESADGVFLERPKNAIVIVNHSTFFNCSISGNKSSETIWYHHPVVGTRQYVYDKRIRDKYKDRFSIDINTTSGTFNLLVQRPDPTDAGRYECVEDVEKDTGASAELTVLDSNLDCEANMVLYEVVGLTQCDNAIAPDKPLLSCSVNYSGSTAPQMEWRKDERASESMKTKCNVTGNLVTCNATLDAELSKDGSVYICQIATAKQYNCSLKVNKTIYTFSDNSVINITLMDEASCFANTSAELTCSYKWLKNNKTEQLGQKLKTNESGTYRCEAECIIRNETCAFTAKQINVLESEGSDGSSRHNLLILVVIPVIILVIPVVILVGVALWMKKRPDRVAQRTQPQPHSQYELMEIERPLVPQTLPVPTTQEEQPAPLQEERELLLASPAQPAQESEPAPLQNIQEEREHLPDPNDSKETEAIDSDGAIGKAFSEAPLLCHGLSGEIYGPVCYKNIQCDCMYERIVCTKDQEDTVCDNGRRWMALNHKNLIKVFDVFLQSSAVYIVMEYATGESIREAVEKRTLDLPIEVVMDWATQIAQGLSQLHENGIIHKNVDSTQIFIVESPDMEATLKIACFNLFGTNASHHSSSVNQKLAISPPEEEYTEKFDVWSFGIVIWEMLTRTEPYKGMGRLKIVNDICNGAKELRIPDSCPEELHEILSGCRIVKPSERPSFSDILLRLKK